MHSDDPSRIAILLFLWCVGALAALIGLAGVIFAGWSMKQDRASQSWPQVTGKIIASSVWSSQTDEDYSAMLRYTYKVDGQTHRGQRLRFGYTPHDERSEAQKEQEQFPEGKMVPVYYDPETPDRSVLVRGAGGYWGQLIGFSICLLIGLAFLFLAIRTTLTKPEASPGP